MEAKQESDTQLRAEHQRVRSLEASLSESKRAQQAVEGNVARLEAENRKHAAALESLLGERSGLGHGPAGLSGRAADPISAAEVGRIRSQVPAKCRFLLVPAGRGAATGQGRGGGEAARRGEQQHATPLCAVSPSAACVP